MIRPLTFLTLFAAIGSGMYLYTEKHRAELLDRQIAHIIRQTEAARERTGLLRAEWALLNEPGRLQTMADQYLQLKPMAPSQFVQMADLASRLPAPLPPNTTSATDTDTTDDAAVAQTPAPDAQTVPAPEVPVAGEPAAVPAPPVAPPPKPARPKMVAQARPKHSTHTGVADRMPHDGLLAHGAPLPLASPQPVGARVMSALARPVATARPRIVAATPSMLAPSPYVGSSLGTRSSLPPPVPLGMSQ